MNHLPITRCSILRAKVQLSRTFNAHFWQRNEVYVKAAHAVFKQDHSRSQSSYNTRSHFDPATVKRRMPSIAPLVPEQRMKCDHTVDIQKRMSSTSRHDRWRRVHVALGSNVGDRLEMIERACHMLSASNDIRMQRTSSLYETAPMYVEEQERFLNGACEV